MIESELYRFTEITPRALVIHRGALPGAGTADACEKLFADNGWIGGWRDGIFAYHHFHATTHEVLGIASGEAEVRFGGPNGPVVGVRAGDVVVIPAGVSHKNEGSSRDFLVVGAYPDGRAPDILKGTPADHPDYAAAIEAVPIPGSDPVYGADGPLPRHWSMDIDPAMTC